VTTVWTAGHKNGAFTASSYYCLTNPTANNLPLWRTNGYSISLWVKGGNGTVGSHIYNETHLTGNSYFDFGIFASGGGSLIPILIRNAANTVLLNKTNGLPVIDSKWHHLVWTDNNGTATLYVDTVVDPINFNYTVSGTMTLNTETIFGYRNSGGNSGQWNNGTIDEVRFYNLVLTPDQVSALYQQ